MALFIFRFHDTEDIFTMILLKSQNCPLSWMQYYGAYQPTSFLELLQNNNIGHLVSEDVQALNNNVCGQVYVLRVYTYI